MIIISMMIMISPEFRIGTDTDNLLQTVLKGKADTLYWILQLHLVAVGGNKMA